MTIMQKSRTTVQGPTQALLRGFPKEPIEELVPLLETIGNNLGGRQMSRLLLAEALELKPASDRFRSLLASGIGYGVTFGSYKAEDVGLTDLGLACSQTLAPTDRLSALRKAVMSPAPFDRFFAQYRSKRMPSGEMLPKILAKGYSVDPLLAEQCARVLVDNARFTRLTRDISGSEHLVIDQNPSTLSSGRITAPEGDKAAVQTMLEAQPEGCHEPPPPVSGSPLVNGTGGAAPKPLYVGHGKNTAPLKELETLLSSFRIPFKVTVREANLGRPISQKVKETMQECGSAILIFTKDEKFVNSSGEELWRPSENAVHELGAASFAYGDRIVIFKERGLHFPTNFQNIGYIEFGPDDLKAKAADLLKELIGFGLLRVTPT